MALSAPEMLKTADRDLAEQRIDVHRHATSIADLRGQERGAGVRKKSTTTSAGWGLAG